MHLYVPAIRLFQRHKTINDNTVTASNGPTMKYHCTMVLAAKKQKNKKTKNKKTKGYLVTTGQANMKDPKQNKFVLF